MNLWATARFVGEDGSLGYRKGAIYSLRMDPTPTNPDWAVVVWRSDGSGMCPYSSNAAFKRNWELLEDEGDTMELQASGRSSESTGASDSHNGEDT